MKSYLIFNLHDIKYGIDAQLVKEVFLLPELTPLAEAPLDIVGILNLRGKIIPVMHLDLRLGNSLSECSLTDSMIVLEWQKTQIGIIINTLEQVIEINPIQIQEEIDYGREYNLNPAFIAGIAQIEEEMIVLLNTEALIRQPDAVTNLLTENDDEKPKKPEEIIKSIRSFYELCCPHATSEEQEIFRRRAEILAQVTEKETETLSSVMPLAVVSLNNEYFGIDLTAVREFIDIRSFTPIPYCPKHIVGNMNLRGEILTLIDIRNNLNLATSNIKSGDKAVVVNVDGIVAGLTVNQVFDVTYLNPQEIAPIPVAMESETKQYLQGTIVYKEKFLNIINLSQLFREGGLKVEEYV